MIPLSQRKFFRETREGSERAVEAQKHAKLNSSKMYPTLTLIKSGNKSKAPLQVELQTVGVVRFLRCAKSTKKPSCVERRETQIRFRLGEKPLQ